MPERIRYPLDLLRYTAMLCNGRLRVSRPRQREVLKRLMVCVLAARKCTAHTWSASHAGPVRREESRFWVAHVLERYRQCVAETPLQMHGEKDVTH